MPVLIFIFFPWLNSNLAGMITIGFSTDPKSWISRLIRWFTKSKYSHAFLLIPDEPILGPCVMQADSGGVEITSFSRFDFVKNPLLKEVKPQMDLGPAVRACADLLNNEYDFPGLLGMVWVEMWWRFFKKKMRNPLHDRGAFFCSAFVVKVLQTANWPGASELVPEDTDAEMLADFLDEHPA
jgi:hypothetical protein